MEKQSKIYVAGHKGLVGSAIVNNLSEKGYNNLVFRTHTELDLTNQGEVRAVSYSNNLKPEIFAIAYGSFVYSKVEVSKLSSDIG